MRLSCTDTMMLTAYVWAQRSTCARRAVGAVIATAHNQIIGVGYNGVARGCTHCTDTPCPGAALPSGTGLDTCEAIHAEINALVNCSTLQSAHSMIVTTAPCVSCTKALINTPIRHIIYADAYPQWSQAKALWCGSHPDRTAKSIGWDKTVSETVYMLTEMCYNQSTKGE